jgi:hypothetical protein
VSDQRRPELTNSESAASGARHRSWCPAPEIPVGVNQCPRCGCWQPGNRGHWTDGTHSAQVRRQLLDGPTAAALAEQRQQVETDLGGTESLTRIQLDLVGRYVEVSALASWLAGNLVAEGALTTRGRARQALAAYLSILDRQHRLALALGLERRQKNMTPLEAWAHIKAAREKDQK